MECTNENPVARGDRAEGDQSRKNSPLNSEPQAPRQAPSAWKCAAAKTLCSLRAKFPDCFAGSRQPLKLKVREDIIASAPEIDPVNVGRALKLYTSHVAYLSQVIEGADRIGIDGKPAGAVTEAEAKHAAELLAKRRKRKPQTAPASPPKKLSVADLKAAAARKRTAAGAAP
jgi:sRNA-binding protein